MVRNSPCAMLITPIWPKMMARPKAISKRTQNTDRPLKPCMAKMAKNSVSETMLTPALGDEIGKCCVGGDACMSRMSRMSLRTPPLCCQQINACDLLITLGERIRFDQVGLIDNLELAILLCFADAGLAPQMMVGMHLNVAFGRRLEFESWRGGHYLVDVEAAGFFHCSLPQPRSEFHAVPVALKQKRNHMRV